MSKDDVSRPVLIYCSTDRTLSYRRKGKEPFRGEAIPVFSVNSEEEAEALCIFVGRVQYGLDPSMPGGKWRKIKLDGKLDFKQYLDVSDLCAVTDKLRQAYSAMMYPKGGQSDGGQEDILVERDDQS